MLLKVLAEVRTIYQPFAEDEALLRKELENLAALPAHSNLIRYYTSFLDERGILHIVTEYIHAVKLYKFIKNSAAAPCPRESVRRWFLQLFKGLACIHSIGMTHRDLHAENILVTVDTRGGAQTCPDSLKIIDVGLAKICKTLEPAVMSVAGVGPAWYFSPERRRGEAFDSLDDVWAAGCMLAEMLVCKGRYIQQHPDHGPGGIDFSLKPAAIQELLRLCSELTSSMGSLAPLAEVPGFVLTPRPQRFTAQQTVEELQELEKISVPSIDLSIYLFIYILPSLHPLSIHPSGCLFTYRSICPSIGLSFQLSIYRPI